MILTKQQNYRLCLAGGYGNRVRHWDSVEAWKQSGFGEPVAMRTALAAGGGPKAFRVQPERVLDQAALWARDFGVHQDQIKIAEMADGRRVLQGQYLNDVYIQDGEVRWGYFLFTFETGPIPEALATSSDVAWGLRADLLLQQYMTPSSYADLQVLMEKYDGHVFELSVWESCLGDTPGRNAIVWEIRRY